MKQNIQQNGLYSDWYVSAMEHLIDVVQDLSHARDRDAIARIVRDAARELTGADGATFVLREDDKCFYVDENALTPLWKGLRFPMSACVSGWAMLNKQSVVIEDIYQDPRIPIDAYKTTFVKSMAMVPIRTQDPIGAIGNYWAAQHCPTQQEIAILQALANVTAVALENVDLYEQLQKKVQALEVSNEELSRFAWAASHDLKSPLRAIDSLASWVEEEQGDKLTLTSQNYMDILHKRVRRMDRLMGDILDFARVEHHLDHDHEEKVSGKELVADLKEIVALNEHFTLEVDNSFLDARVQRRPMTRVLQNLLNNAVVHHDKPQGHITLSADADQLPGKYLFSVKDDGPGIPVAYREKVFEMFQTIQPRDIKEGSGMGLAFVKKIVELYGGNIWIDPENPKGTRVLFTWPRDKE